MEFKTLIFYAFSSILVLAALRVVTARNPVHAVMFLVLSFFTAASLWILLGAEFLGIVLVLVYIGAVMVLFLFVVMMLDIDLDQIRQGFRKSMALAVPIGIVIVLEMGAVLTRGFWDKKLVSAAGTAKIGSTRELGIALFTKYVYAFEIAAAILLVAMIAAVALTYRRRQDATYSDPSEAVKVKREDRVRLVSMPAEMPEPAQPSEQEEDDA